MVIKITSLLSCSPETCFSHVKTTRLLKYVSWPMVCFTPVKPAALPEVWKEQNYVVKIRVFCLVPFGSQSINITTRDRTKEKEKFYVELRDNGSSTFITKWDHVIEISGEESKCFYSDEVQIQAGLLTPIVAIFAWFFYRHRQNRWRKLVKSGFKYD